MAITDGMNMDQSTGVGAGIGTFLGGIAGEIWAQADEANRKVLMERAFNLYGNIDPKSIERVIQEQAGPSAFNDIELDPSLRNAEQAALDRLMASGNAGGLDAQAMSKIGAAQADASQYSRAQRGAIDNSAMARGTYGGGEQYAASLVGEQGGAMSAHMGGLEASADAEARALQAMLSGGEMAGKMRGQDYGIERDKAASNDAVNQFNARMRHSANMFNADAQNSVFGREMDLADAKAGRLDSEAKMYQESADRKRRIGAETGRAAGATAGAVAKTQGF